MKNLWSMKANLAIGLSVVLVLSFALNSIPKADGETVEILIPDRLPLLIHQQTEDWIADLNIKLRDTETNFIISTTSRLAELKQDVVRDKIAGAWIRLSDSPQQREWTSVLSSPGRVGSSALLSAIMWRLHDKAFSDSYEFIDLKVLSFVVMPPPILRFSRAVAGLGDVNGQALRCQTSECALYLSYLGVGNTFSADEKVSIGLKQQRYLGVFFQTLDSGAPRAFVDEWKAATPYVQADPIAWPRDIFALIVSQEVWNRMTPGVQEVVQNHSGERFSEELGGRVELAHRRFLRAEIPFLTEYKIVWSIDDLRLLKKVSQDVRDMVIRNAESRSGSDMAIRLRSIEQILVEQGH